MSIVTLDKPFLDSDYVVLASTTRWGLLRVDNLTSSSFEIGVLSGDSIVDATIYYMAVHK